MEIDEMITYWLEEAEVAFKSAASLFESGIYHHSLFFCHLAVEKTLKAAVVKHTGEQPIPTHDLLLLAKKAGLEPPAEKITELSEINGFNLRTRYDSYKREFYQKATRTYAEEWHTKSREVFQWIKEHL